jgi:hypothetical protein
MTVANRPGASQSSRAFVDPLRQHHGRAGVDPQAVQVGDLRQGAGECREPLVAQRQGVAAAEDHLRDGRARGDVVERRPPLLAGRVGVRVGKVAPEAVAAVHGAGPGGEQEHATRVLVQQARHHHGVVVPHRIVPVAGRVRAFGIERKHLAQQGVMGVARVHARQIAFGDAQAEVLRRAAGGRQQRRIQAETPEEHRGIGDGGRLQALPGRRLS